MRKNDGRVRVCTHRGADLSVHRGIIAKRKIVPLADTKPHRPHEARGTF